MLSEDICNYIPSRSINKDLVAVHFVREKELFLETPRLENTYSINIVAEGSGVLHTSFGDFPVAKGDLFFTFPEHSYRVENIRDMDYIYITYLGVRANSLAERLQLKMQSPVFCGHSDLLPVWEAAITGAVSSNVDMLAEGLLLYTLAAICKSAEEKAVQKGSGSIELQVKRYLEEHFCESDLTLASVAAKFRYNEKYISQKFRKVVKLSFSEYLQDLRLNFAAAQIADGEKNVTQLAQSCGYEDPLYFSRVFAKKYGLSPKKYILLLSSGEQDGPGNL